MKKLSVLLAACGVAFFGAAHAADITVYYSPSCPHCHHARDFIGGTLVYEYPSINVTMIDVMPEQNRDMFRETVKKCELKSGGVPVIVIGEKCFQGYADFMQNDIRAAIEVDMSEADKSAAAENQKAMRDNAEEFKSKNAARADAIQEYDATAAQKKTKNGSAAWFYIVLAALVAGLGFVLIRQNKKN